MAANKVIIKASAPDVEVTALLDEAGAVVTGGYGDWEVIARPRRQGITHWAGRSPFTMDLALIFDGHSRFETVETQISRLERLALPHPNPGGAPPVVTLIGEAIPHHDITDWVIQNLTFGDLIRDRNGHRTRQHIVVSLLRYVQVDKIQVTAAADARNKAGGNIRTVPVNKGDTLQKIAARYLGKGHLYREIWKLNTKIADPGNLKGLTTVKIPPKQPKTKK